MIEQSTFSPNAFMNGRFYDVDSLRRAVSETTKVMIREYDQQKLHNEKYLSVNEPWKNYRTQWPDTRKASVHNWFIVFLQLPPRPELNDITLLPVGLCGAVLIRFPDDWGITGFFDKIYSNSTEMPLNINCQFAYDILKPVSE